ncbi:MAG: hypothetical protein KA797_06840 [Chitinophagales bacterium]|nr:hypothetical protein [Chitinophagales bacterium]
MEFREEEIKKVNNRNYYVIDLYIDDEKVSTGEGFSKKVAEQIASRKAMEGMVVS